MAPDPAGSMAAHPRSRGENWRWLRQQPRTWGSSPLTRGKPRVSVICRARSRLIPAHAGKTALRSTPASRSTAHPRSRGENTDPLACADGPPGSSPLTRGKLDTVPQKLRARRLIPAHAGKTGTDARLRRGPAAHPRSRGENKGTTLLERHVDGSSPLTRGKLRARFDTRVTQRLIPAHAGKTRD